MRRIYILFLITDNINILVGDYYELKKKFEKNYWEEFMHMFKIYVIGLINLKYLLLTIGNQNSK